MSVSVVITCCNRPILLKKTLESFLKYNTYPIEKYIIIEDSGNFGINDFILNMIDSDHLELIYNEKNLGHIVSVDKAYEKVKTQYIFHLEEDWEFYQYSFIEKSIEILCKDSKIFTVWLRSHWDTNNHPFYRENLGGYYKIKTDHFYYDSGVKYTWGGFTFNPGFRRTEDCKLFGPYSKINDGKFVWEYDVNTKYREAGYYSVITDNPNGYVKHIGYGHHVTF